MSADPFYTHGPPQLCVWKVAPGTFWFQTTDPQYARKLDKREDARRVAITGVNHYRRTYEMRGNWRKVRGIIDRYLVSASDQFSSNIRLQDASQMRGSLRIAGGPQDESFRR